MLLMSYYYGLEYHIILDCVYDYFELIPDLEKRFHARFKLQGEQMQWDLTKSSSNKLVVITVQQTMDRFDKTEYFRTWYANKNTRQNDMLDCWEKFCETMSTEEFEAMSMTDRSVAYDKYLNAHCPEMDDRMFSINELPIELTPKETTLVEDVTNFLQETGQLKEAFWIPIELFL